MYIKKYSICSLLFLNVLEGFLEENYFEIKGEVPKKGGLALKFIREIEPYLAILDLDISRLN
jgi:hypothetical protein